MLAAGEAFLLLAGILVIGSLAYLYLYMPIARVIKDVRDKNQKNKKAEKSLFSNRR